MAIQLPPKWHSPQFSSRIYWALVTLVHSMSFVSEKFVWELIWRRILSPRDVDLEEIFGFFGEGPRLFARFTTPHLILSTMLATFDEHLTFSDQISAISKACYYHIRQLSLYPSLPWFQHISHHCQLSRACHPCISLPSMSCFWLPSFLLLYLWKYIMCNIVNCTPDILQRYF